MATDKQTYVRGTGASLPRSRLAGGPGAFFTDEDERELAPWW
jgi:hypothetical protein